MSMVEVRWMAPERGIRVSFLKVCELDLTAPTPFLVGPNECHMTETCNSCH